MDEEDYCYCHYHDDTYEYFDCLDYMECEECPYYYADEDQVVKQMNTTEEYKGCRNCKYQPEPMHTCDKCGKKFTMYGYQSGWTYYTETIEGQATDDEIEDLNN